MTNQELYENLESKVVKLTTPILEYFQENKNDTYYNLKDKWNYYNNILKNKMVVVLLECITDTGIDITKNQDEDMEIKQFILQTFQYPYNDLIVKFYNEDIYPIIFKRFQEIHLTLPNL